MNKGDWQRLWHIKVHCEDVTDFIERFGRDYQVFINDRAYYNAVSMAILQIGELANGLSDDFREKTKDEMPWHEIRAMRNLFAHNYAQMDEEMVWETATVSIPEMQTFCQKHMDPQSVSHEDGLSIHDILQAKPPQRNIPVNKHKNKEPDR